MDSKMEKNIIAATPMARRGTPEEVAKCLFILASDEASYVTGALYAVDGGITIAKGPVGEEVPDNLRKQPEGDVALQHDKDGHNQNKSKISVGWMLVDGYSAPDFLNQNDTVLKQKTALLCKAQLFAFLLKKILVHDTNYQIPDLYFKGG
jgi:hypothetical protein